MKALYIDLKNSGISGDMFLASLLGLITEPHMVVTELTQIKDYFPDVSHLDMELVKIQKSGIRPYQLKIEIKEKKDHRSAITLQDSLNKYLNENSYSNSAKEYANQVLNCLIHAEAEVHGKEAKKIHLHELSSVDTLIDILGVTTVLDKINGFDETFHFYCSILPLGGGEIDTAHGKLAVPAPATVKILRDSGIISEGGPVESELVTPTGIALLANLNPIYLKYLPEMKIIKSSYGTGQKKFSDFPNILRLFYGDKQNDIEAKIPHPLQSYTEDITILETDVDDVSGEILGNLVNELTNEEILDIQIIPSMTKKNRPSYIIKVLCHPRFTYQIMEKIINELGTLGVRYYTVNRVCVERDIDKRTIEISGEKFKVNFKISYFMSEKGREIVNIKPEYEDVKRISEQMGIPVRKIMLLVLSQIKQQFT
ncbi:MAG: nickel pincer cofactor biosynthesis protein LarC [Promethearchaeota archaeon]|jgi:uncharacterized protein (TIGR00299 family) protein